MNQLIHLITKKKYTHICILGDFNFKDINWETYSTHQSLDSKEAKFLNTIQDCYLYQHVTKPTRRRGKDQPSKIDLIFTDESMQVSDIVHHAPLGKSDHDVLSFKFHCYLDFAKAKPTHAYKKADYNGMRRAMANWSELFEVNCRYMSVEESWGVFKSKLHQLRDEFVPVSIPNDRPRWSKKGCIPVSKPLLVAIKQKQKSHRRLTKCKTDSTIYSMLHDEYKVARKNVKNLMRQAKRVYEKKIALGSKENPKAFWAHVRQKLKTKPGVAPLLANNLDLDSTKFNDKEKAEILQNQCFYPGTTGKCPHFSEEN